MDGLQYMKETPRLNVVFYNGDTGEKLFEVKDRDWMNVGEFMTDHHVSDLIFRTIPEEALPDSIKVRIEGEFFLYEV